MSIAFHLRMVVPRSWNLANVQAMPKKGARADLVNYKRISDTSTVYKTMECVPLSKYHTYAVLLSK